MLTVSGSAFTENTAGANGGGIDNIFGGTLTVGDSTFTGNSATNHGGGIDNFATATVGGSTFAGNTAGSGNGGLNNEPGGLLTQFDNLFINDQLPDVFP
jgi:predicted outer membrane repeat protein